MKGAIHRKILIIYCDIICINISYPLRGPLLGYTELEETIATFLPAFPLSMSSM